MKMVERTKIVEDDFIGSCRPSRKNPGTAPAGLPYLTIVVLVFARVVPFLSTISTQNSFPILYRL